MTLADDWFHEPQPEPTKHDAYTRRLRAWGWLHTDGKTLAWDVSPLQMLTDLYLKPIKVALNERVLFIDGDGVRYGRYGDAWWDDPEAPVS